MRVLFYTTMKNIYLSLFSISILLTACAQFVAPTGGKRDEMPPKLINSIPKNGQKLYKENTMVLEFDELVDASSLRQELLITPETEGGFEIKTKSNRVQIKFSNQFKDSTTYTLNFRKGIKDLNERNETRNLMLVFSTGNIIDSLKIAGNIKSLKNNLPILDALVGLYSTKDSINIKKNKPDYFIKTDSSGNFSFENIKSGSYRVYSFVDKNNNLRYDPKSESIGFLKDTIQLNKHLKNIIIAIYEANNEKPKNIKTIQRVEDFSILFDKSIKDYQIGFENPNDSLPYLMSKKELKFFNTINTNDTIPVRIMVADSNGNQLMFGQKIKFRENNIKKKGKQENFDFDISVRNGQDIEKNILLDFEFKFPITQLNPQKIIIKEDTVNQIDIQEQDLLWNKSKTKLSFRKQINAKKELTIKLQTGAFINFKGDSSKNYTQRNPILKPENYGLIEGSLSKANNNKIIQLINEKYEVVLEQITKEKFLFKNVKPGMYLIRVIDDINENGFWDCGNVEKEIEAEKITFFNEPIKVKSNFEIRNLLIK